MLRVAVCSLALSLAFSFPAYATGNKKDKGKQEIKVNVSANQALANKNINGNLNQNKLTSKNLNKNHNANDNKNNNKNSNKNANNNKNVNKNSNANKNNNKNLNKNANNNKNNNKNLNKNSNQQAQDQAQKQKQDQQQDQSQGQDQNQSQSADNDNNINIDGDETFVTYEQAAAQAAVVFANSRCATEGASAGNVEKVFSSARESAYCRNLTMAMAYLDAMMSNEYIFVPHLDGQLERIKQDIIQWETDIRDIQESFEREMIKGSSGKSENRIIAEQRFLSWDRKVKAEQLPERYGQYSEAMALRVDLQDRYAESLEGFYASINSAEVSIKRRGLTGFFVESLTDIVTPVALVSILFK